MGVNCQDCQMFRLEIFNGQLLNHFNIFDPLKSANIRIFGSLMTYGKVTVKFNS